jgi:AcrR family transcriptional regulator
VNDIKSENAVAEASAWLDTTVSVYSGIIMNIEKSQDERYEQTRKRLLSAGLDLLARMGYRGATSREIAREAGVTEVTMYRHFKSKDELFAAAIMEQREPLMSLIPEPTGNLEKDLLQLAEQFYKHLSSDAVQLMRVIPELRKHWKLQEQPVEKVLGEFGDKLQEFIRYYQVSGDLVDEPVTNITTSFLGPLYFYSFGDIPGTDVEFNCQRYVHRFLNGYRK